MTAKEYLMQIYRLNEELEINKDRVRELESNITWIKAVDYSGDKVSSSHNDKMCEQVAKLVDLEQKVRTESLEIQEKKDKIISEIKQIGELSHLKELQKAKYIKVLTLRYVNCKRWEKIACDMSESIRHVHRIHGEALNAFKSLDIAM